MHAAGVEPRVVAGTRLDVCSVWAHRYRGAQGSVCARAVCAQHGALRAWDHESKSWSLRILAQAPNETALRRAHDGIMSRTTNLLIAHVHLHQNCQDLGDRGTAHADTRSVDSQPRSVWSR